MAWKQQILAIDKKVNAELRVSGEAETTQKRALYCELELLRDEWASDPAIAQYLTSKAAQRKASAADKPEFTSNDDVDSVLAEFDRVQARLHRKVDPPGSKLIQLARLLVILTYTTMSLPVLIILLPLRWLHPTLRTVGLKNNFLPIDVIQKLWSRGWLCWCGITVQFEGFEHVEFDKGCIGMFSHASNADPFVLASGPLAFKWIGKRSLFFFPFIGWLLHGWGHFPIDRSNRESAIRTLDSALTTLNKYKRNLAISPEGTRSSSGRLMSFKKGPFHTALQARIPITPVILIEAINAWPKGLMSPRPRVITVRFLPQIAIEKDDTAATLSRRVRAAMLRGQVADVEPKRAVRYFNAWLNFLRLPLCYLLLFALYCLWCRSPL